jgi:hypothetical protein
MLLKNNLIESAMVLGEGVAPAIGRAAKKLSEFLKQGENRAMLKGLGEDIGKAIDGIDWSRLLKAAKGLAQAFKPALAFVMQLADLIAKLPPELLGAGAGILVTDRLSGGAISSGLGNIFGGLGEVLAKSLLSRIPIIGAGFVQPVFVTNMGGIGGPGGVVPTGGKGGVGGALGAIGKVFLVGMAAGVAVELAAQLGQQSTEIQQQGADLVTNTKTNAPKMTEKEIVAALAAVRAPTKDPLSTIALLVTNPLNKGFDNLVATEKALVDQLVAVKANTATTSANTGSGAERAAAQAQQLAGVKAAALESARAIRAKKWDVDVNVRVPVSVRTTVSVRDHAVAVRANAAYQGSGKVRGIGTG